MIVIVVVLGVAVAVAAAAVVVVVGGGGAAAAAAAAVAEIVIIMITNKASGQLLSFHTVDNPVGEHEPWFRPRSLTSMMPAIHPTHAKLNELQRPAAPSHCRARQSATRDSGGGWGGAQYVEL